MVEISVVEYTDKPQVNTPHGDVKDHNKATVNVNTSSLKWFALILVLFLALALVGALFVYIVLRDESAADKAQTVVYI